MAGAAGGLVLGVLTAAPAHAGSYVVVACDRSVNGGAAPAWESAASPGFAALNRCPTDGTVRGGLYATTPAGRDSTFLENGGFTFLAPDGARLGSLSLDAALARNAEYWTAGVVAFSNNSLNPERYVYGCAANQACSVPDGVRSVGPLDLGGLRGVRIQVACGSGDRCLAGADAARFSGANLRVTVLDDSAPSVAVRGLESGTRSRSQPVEFDATDNVGVRRVALLVDGAEKAVLAPGCDPTQRVPCPNVSGGSLSLSGTDVADGPHELALRTTDSAGNVSEAKRSVVLTSPPPPARTAITAAAAGRKGSAAQRPTVRPGRSVTVRGRLTFADGRPLAGVAVDVLATQLRTGAPLRVPEARVTTSADGGFAYRAPAGPARVLDFSFAGSEGAAAAVVPIVVRVPASSSIRVSPRRTRLGRRITLSGTLALRGAPVPRLGKIIVLQAFDRGRWRTFATTRTSRTGRWRRAYRFQRQPGSYRFRARIRREASFPYFTGSSRSVQVTVRR